MKKLIYIFLLIPYLIFAITYQTEPINNWSPLSIEKGIYAGILKDNFAYTISFLYANESVNKVFFAGISADIYDNIELTALPDTMNTPSPVNVPFISNTVNAYAAIIPAGINISINNFEFGFMNIFSYQDLLGSYNMTNSVNASMRYTLAIYYAEINIYNALKTVSISEGEFSLNYAPKAEIVFNSEIINSNDWKLNGRINISIGRNDYEQYHMKYYIYGANRSFGLDASYKKIVFGGEFFSPKMKIYAGYKPSEHYSIYAGYSGSADLTSLNLFMRFNI